MRRTALTLVASSCLFALAPFAASAQEQVAQVGLASWYGNELAGRPTASGEPFEPNRLTAAHRTLPLGTKVAVENLSNGRTVTVTITDRGPYKGERVIDLSEKAARQLKMVDKGVAKVRITAEEDES